MESEFGRFQKMIDGVEKRAEKDAESEGVDRGFKARR